jgi:hypothetical protein
MGFAALNPSLYEGESLHCDRSARNDPTRAAAQVGSPTGRIVTHHSLKEGLLHVYGVETSTGGHTVPQLIEQVLGLEYEHWGKTLKLDDVSNMLQAIKNGVAQLTLVGGTGSRAADAVLIAADPFYGRDIDPPRVQRALERLFPGSGDGLAAPEPDLIGEHHVAEKHTQAFGDLVRALRGDYLAACEKAGMEADVALLERGARALGGGDAGEGDSEAEA